MFFKSIFDDLCRRVRVFVIAVCVQFDIPHWKCNIRRFSFHQHNINRSIYTVADFVSKIKKTINKK